MKTPRLPTHLQAAGVLEASAQGACRSEAVRLALPRPAVAALPADRIRLGQVELGTPVVTFVAAFVPFATCTSCATGALAAVGAVRHGAG
eukprot:7390661-Pyramimonas_sp.AAC.1